MLEIIQNIKSCEIEAIEMAKQGKNYEHIMAEMSAYTHNLLSYSKAPIEVIQKLTQPISLSENTKVYKDVPSPGYMFYADIKLEDVVYVKEFRSYTTRALQARMASALNRFNQVTGNAHCYESHRTKNELRLRRVG